MQVCLDAAVRRKLPPYHPSAEPKEGSVHTTPRLPPVPHCFGRAAEVETLVAALCAESPRPVPVLGPGGVGKTTVALAALHDCRVLERFGARRYFIRCDSATSRDSLVGEIVIGLGLEPGGQLEARAFRELERGPSVLLLDNAETPWEKDIERTEQLLGQLGELPGLALVASIRGTTKPPENVTTRPVPSTGVSGLSEARRTASRVSETST